MTNHIPDRTLTLPAAATADVTRDPAGQLVIDLTDPDAGGVARLRFAAEHPGDARVTVGLLLSALVELDVELHGAELAFEWQQEVAS